MTGREPIEAVKDKAYWLTEQVEAALEAGEIDETEWHRRIGSVITPAYLAADTPWGQSGKLGDERSWTHARSLICDAIDRDGSFLDVGCASGYLMECVKRWAAERGRRIEPHGLDISPELADLARGRLHDWADRIHTGNVMTWTRASAIRFRTDRSGVRAAPPQARPRTSDSRWLLIRKWSSDPWNILWRQYLARLPRGGDIVLGIQGGRSHEPASSRRPSPLPCIVD